MTSLLVIEDNVKLQRNLREVLRREGYHVWTATTGEEGLQVARRESIDAVILDLSLPGKDGMEVLRSLRECEFLHPIIIVTARDAVDDRVAGLDLGADDYLVKPFAHAELLARIRALLRRSPRIPLTTMNCGDLVMDLLRREVKRGEVVVALTQREFDLLEYLLRRKNSPVTRDMLARDVWHEPLGVLTNVIEVCMNGLRRKLHVSDSLPPMIHTVRGVGYLIKDEP